MIMELRSNNLVISREPYVVLVLTLLGHLWYAKKFTEGLLIEASPTSLVSRMITTPIITTKCT